MRILVCCDDKWHPAATPRAGLAPLAGERFVFDWLEDGAAWAGVRLDEFDVVLLTKSNNISPTNLEPWMTPAVEAALVDFVFRGGGLLAVHSGTVGYDAAPALHALLGGAFAQHPPQCDVTITPIAGHPLTADVEAFTIRDEHYFMTLAGDRATYDHWLTTTSTHGAQPGGWTHRTQRVCVLTPGHTIAVWQHPGFQQLLFNGLTWCGAGGSPR